MLYSEKNHDNNTKEKISIKTVEYIAELAKINIGEDEKEPFTKELQDIVDFAEMISELDMDEIDIKNNDMELKNVVRKDIVENNFSRVEMLKNAPRKIKGCIVAPKIMD